MAIGLGASSQLGIGIAIRLENQFSAGAAQVRRELSGLKRNTDTLIDTTLSKYRNAQLMLATGAGLVSRGFWKMTQRAAEFGHQINQIDIVGEGAIGKTKTELSKMARDLANQLYIKPSEVTTAMFENAKAGIRDGIEEMTKFQLAASRAVDESAEVVSKAIIAAHNSFNIAYSDAQRVADAYTYTANATISSYASLAEGMTQVGFTANSFNMDLEQTVALLGRLSQAGITGSQSGTWLKNAILYLGTSAEKPTDKQAQAYKALGVNPEQIKNAINAGHIGEVIDILDENMSKMTTTSRALALRTLANLRGMQGLLGITGYDLKTGERLRGDIKSYHDLLTGIKGAKGVTLDQATRMKDDLLGTMQGLSIAWENFRLQLVENMAPVLTFFINGLKKLVGFLTPIVSNKLGGSIVALLGVLATGVAALAAFRFAITTAVIALRSFTAGASSRTGFLSLMRLGLGSPMGAIPTMFSSMLPLYGSITSSRRGIGRDALVPFFMGGKLYGEGRSMIAPERTTGTIYARGLGEDVIFGRAKATQGSAVFSGGRGRVISAGTSSRGIMGGLTRGFGGMSMVFSKLLPVLGIVTIGASIYSGVKDLIAQGKQAEIDRANALREQQLKDKEFSDNMVLNLAKFWSGNPNLTTKQISSDLYSKAQERSQKNQIQIYVDGNKKYEELLEATAREFKRTTQINL